MSHCTACVGAAFDTRIVPEYDADILGAPFKVLLHDAVKVEVCITCGTVLNTAIPDPEGLLYAISFSRALHTRKLVGAEVKFMRHVMGWKGKKLAEELGITPEHLSRCENGHAVMSPPTEKLFRLYSILLPKEISEPRAEAKVRAMLQDAVDDLIKAMNGFKIEATWGTNEPLVFHFQRCRLTQTGEEGPGSDDGKWRPEKQAA